LAPAAIAVSGRRTASPGGRSAQAFGERRRVDTRTQPQVDPAQQPDALERDLCPAMSITARR
jgi:hypothetical protein